MPRIRRAAALSVTALIGFAGLPALATALTLTSAIFSVAFAQDTWNPFQEKSAPARPKRQAEPPPAPLPPVLAPMDGAKTWRPDQASAGQAAPAKGPKPAGGAQPDQTSVDRQSLPPLDERSRAVERAELQPVLTNDGSGLPLDFWQGLDAKSAEELIARLDIPPRSAALFALWRRLWASNATPPGGAGSSFEALRLEVLYRSGQVADLTARVKEPQAVADPLLTALRARVSIGVGDRAQGCSEARAALRSGSDTPKPIKAELLLLSGYCAAAEGNREAADLAVELARAEDIHAPLALAALDAVSSQQAFRPTLPKRVSLMDYRFLELAQAARPADVLERAEPALLVTLATSTGTDPQLRVAAGEAAARMNVLDPEGLAVIYRLQGLPAGDPLTTPGDRNTRRAVLFKAIEAERTPMRKARLVRALLDDARRSGLYLPIASILGPPTEDLAPVQEIGWFAETAVEINLAAGRYDAARTWLDFSGRDRGAGLQHWLALVDLADPKWPGPRGASLQFAEDLALKGRLSSDLLHRLATVLDALDYQVPIPLWEIASRTPQPTTGHLPETGILTQLQAAAKKREFARTVLLAMRTLGAHGAEAAHMIALGDAIRALKRAGLEPDARRLALEAVFAAWPRMAIN